MSSRQRRRRNERKRRREDDATRTGDQFGVGETLNLLNGAPTNEPEDPIPEADGDEWVQVKKRKKGDLDSKNESSLLGEDRPYPAITHSANVRLQSHVRITDFQSLVLWLLADGPAPQWVSVTSGRAINRAVVVMVPGLESGMFDGTIPLTYSSFHQNSERHDMEEPRTAEDLLAETQHVQMVVSPDDYYPVRLTDQGLPGPLRGLASIFSHVWPVKTPGDNKMSKMFSPLRAILSTPIPKNQEQTDKEELKRKNEPTPIAQYVASASDLIEHDFVLHPALFTDDGDNALYWEKRARLKQTAEHGWLDLEASEMDLSIPKKTTGVNMADKVYAIDCEMCMTDEDSFDLTRISIVDWSGAVVLDELVKPSKPITNYLTPFSGMTKEKLDPVTTTLEDVQARLIKLLKPGTIVAGHGLNSDFNAMKVTHPAIVDTTILYPHVRGLPLRNSLKFLAQKYLSREIQKSGGGHDSIEDARSALDLVKLKCERGPLWGTHEANSESIFRRLSRTPKPKGDPSRPTTGAVVDWGFPQRGYGSTADVCIGCKNDAEVAAGVQKAIRGDETDSSIPGGGVDFVWARMRGLEAFRGWWNTTKTADNEELLQNARAEAQGNGDSANGIDGEQGEAAQDLGSAVSRTTEHLKEIFDSLPPCTAFIVYSGNGDPRDLARLQDQLRRHKKEYATRKWDQLSVHWTDRDEKLLQDACRRARNGIGFVTVA